MEQLIAGRYALGPLVGSGGAARVFAADDQRLHRRVAIKLVPLAQAEPIARQRFVREARSLAGFTHPNAVAIFDAGEADGYLYLVMELVDGSSLAQHLEAHGALDPGESRAIASSVLGALAAAHAAGIVHRDVKPANILLGRDGTVKLADFGIAKRLDELPGDVTVLGNLIGTPKYLAPEQVGGHPATPASDVYAVGVVLYEMLSGEPPFDADTPMATALAHREEPVPDLTLVRPDVPVQLLYAVETAMAKNPIDRFGSALAMLDALGAGPAAVPVHPQGGQPQPTQVMPAGGYAGRTRTPLWIALVAALAIAGVVVGAVVVTNDDDNDGAGATSVAAPIDAASTTTVVSTTTTPTTVATTTPSPPADLSTIDGIIATLESDPTRFGPATDDVIDALGGIHGNGRSAERTAAALLDQAGAWVETGELDASVLTMLEPVLGPIAGAGNGDEEEGDD